MKIRVDSRTKALLLSEGMPVVRRGENLADKMEFHVPRNRGRYEMDEFQWLATLYLDKEQAIVSQLVATGMDDDAIVLMPLEQQIIASAQRWIEITLTATSNNYAHQQVVMIWPGDKKIRVEDEHDYTK